MQKLAIFCLVLIMIVFDAEAVNFGLVRQRALKAPQKAVSNITSLTHYLIKPFKDDEERVYVIAYWIASHIAYDSYKSYELLKSGKTRLNYDVLEARSGICGDFAALFQDMATAAGIKNVETVRGYVLENQNSLKKHYRQKDMPEIGHAWNKVTLGKRSFFVDTTFMAKEKIGQEYENRNFVPKFKHKIELKNRARRNEVNQNITEFFIDFTPKKELKEYGILHIRDKYVK